MEYIPKRFFDSLVHFQDQEQWLKTGKDSRIDNYINNSLKLDMPPEGVIALMPGEDYSYIQKVRKEYDGFRVFYTLTPDDISIDSWDLFLTNLQRQGFSGIKLHPRFSKFLPDKKFPIWLDKLMVSLVKLNWPLYFCTIFRKPSFPIGEPVYEYLYRFAEHYSDNKIVFLHGGYLDIFPMGEVIRDLPNAYLDLSFTFMRFRKSSLALDIGYLFETLDRKLTIGTDFPESTSTELIKEINKYIISRDDLTLADEKLENIFYNNMKGLLDD